MASYEINEIVKGKICGFFVVLGHRCIGGEAGLQLSAIDRNTQTKYVGELWLPLDAVEKIN